MSLSTENTRKTSADFSQYFGFLTEEFGLKMIMENYSITGGDRYVRTLRNQFVQVELAGDQSYFHAEIRRLIEGEPRPYSDERNNIGFEDLAVLASNNTYDHMDFYPAKAGWINVLNNTSELFRKSITIFTTDKWVDTDRIESLKDEEMFRKFGFRPSENKNKPTFFSLAKEHAFKLITKGYKIVFDNSELPPYSNESILKKIILEGFGTQIKISQTDWRDDYTIYYIAVNDIKKFQINTTSYPNPESAGKVFNETLDKIISTIH